jgi:hypothetical protein
MVLFAIIGIEFTYNQALIEWSVRAMREIQANKTPGGVSFFKLVSVIGLGPPYFLAAILIMNWNSERGRTFYHVLFLCFALFLMSVTKMAYGEPRMFWWVTDIVPDECTAEFGNPSGHTLLAIAYPMVLYLDIFETKEARERHGERMSCL